MMGAESPGLHSRPLERPTWVLSECLNWLDTSDILAVSCNLSVTTEPPVIQYVIRDGEQRYNRDQLAKVHETGHGRGGGAEKATVRLGEQGEVRVNEPE